MPLNTHGTPAAVDPTHITSEMFERVLPKKMKVKLTPKIVANINNVLQDQQLRENFRDNLLSYTSVLNDGRFHIQKYIDAVKYVSFKLLGSTNIEAYTKTFPDRFQRLINEQATEQVISSYCAGYNRTMLVQKILEQTLTPNHVLNADLYQKALNRSAWLMMNANSEKVQADAANNVMQQLRQPEVTKMELDVNIREDQSIQELREATLALAAQQRKIIQNGTMTVKEVAHSKLVLDVTPDLVEHEK